MFDFLENIKTYLENCFNNDSDITLAKKPKVYDSYQVNHEPSREKPEIQVRILNNSEQVNYTTFCNKKADSIPLQITVYCGKMKIAGTDRNPQHSSIIMADKIDRCIYNLIYAKENSSINNDNIISGRKISASPALPMDENGTIYATSLRYNFIIESPYVTG